MNEATTNGNGHAPSKTEALLAGKAARAVRRMGESSLALVAKERGMSPLALLKHLDGLELAAAEAGDMTAVRGLRERLVAQLVGLGRANSSKKAYQRVARAVSSGVLTLDEGAKALRFVEVRRSLETSDLDARLRRIESVAGPTIRRAPVQD